MRQTGHSTDLSDPGEEAIQAAAKHWSSRSDGHRLHQLRTCIGSWKYRAEAWLLLWIRRKKRSKLLAKLAAMRKSKGLI